METTFGFIVDEMSPPSEGYDGRSKKIGFDHSSFALDTTFFDQY